MRSDLAKAFIAAAMLNLIVFASFVADTETPWGWRICALAYVIFMVSTVRWLWQRRKTEQHNPLRGHQTIEYLQTHTTNADYALTRPAFTTARKRTS